MNHHHTTTINTNSPKQLTVNVEVLFENDVKLERHRALAHVAAATQQKAAAVGGNNNMPASSSSSSSPLDQALRNFLNDRYGGTLLGTVSQRANNTTTTINIHHKNNTHASHQPGSLHQRPTTTTTTQKLLDGEVEEENALLAEAAKILKEGTLSSSLPRCQRPGKEQQEQPSVAETTPSATTTAGMRVVVTIDDQLAMNVPSAKLLRLSGVQRVSFSLPSEGSLTVLMDGTVNNGSTTSSRSCRVAAISGIMLPPPSDTSSSSLAPLPLHDEEGHPLGITAKSDNDSSEEGLVVIPLESIAFDVFPYTWRSSVKNCHHVEDKYVSGGGSGGGEEDALHDATFTNHGTTPWHGDGDEGHENGGAQCGGTLLHLPSAELDGLWESLIYDDDEAEDVDDNHKRATKLGGVGAKRKRGQKGGESPFCDGHNNNNDAEDHEDGGRRDLLHRLQTSFRHHVRRHIDERSSAATSTVLSLNATNAMQEKRKKKKATVKQRLLNYTETALRFAAAGVDGNIVAHSRLILLYGPPGTGKTSLCKALAQKLAILHSNERDTYLFEVNAHSIFSRFYSESGKKVLQMFQQITALASARTSTGTTTNNHHHQQKLIFLLIDEVESLAAARRSAMEGNEPSDAIRVVNALLTQLDALRHHPNVFILSTTNLPDAVDIAFADRADMKIHVGPPSMKSRARLIREALVELQTKGLVGGGVDGSEVVDHQQQNDSTVSDKPPTRHRRCACCACPFEPFLVPTTTKQRRSNSTVSPFQRTGRGVERSSRQVSSKSTDPTTPTPNNIHHGLTSVPPPSVSMPSSAHSSSSSPTHSSSTDIAGSGAATPLPNAPACGESSIGGSSAKNVVTSCGGSPSYISSRSPYTTARPVTATSSHDVMQQQQLPLPQSMQRGATAMRHWRVTSVAAMGSMQVGNGDRLNSSSSSVVHHQPLRHVVATPSVTWEPSVLRTTDPPQPVEGRDNAQHAHQHAHEQPSSPNVLSPPDGNDGHQSQQPQQSDPFVLFLQSRCAHCTQLTVALATVLHLTRNWSCRVLRKLPFVACSAVLRSCCGHHHAPRLTTRQPPISHHAFIGALLEAAEAEAGSRY